MAEFEQPWAFTPPENSYESDDGEYYWLSTGPQNLDPFLNMDPDLFLNKLMNPDTYSEKVVMTYTYSEQKPGSWIVGYHTVGSRECKDGEIFNSEHEARQHCYNNLYYNDDPNKKYPQFA